MKFKALLLSTLAFSAHAHVSFESATPIYELELNQNNEFESQLHDYLNDVLQSCGEKVVRWSRFDSYFHQFDPKSNKAEMCASLFNEPLKIKCGDVMGTLQSGANRPKKLPDEYPVVDGADLAGNAMLAGFVSCHINDTFAKYDEQMPMFSGYSFKVDYPVFKKMKIQAALPKDIHGNVIEDKSMKGKPTVAMSSYTVLEHPVTLIPDVVELAEREATIVVVNSASLEGAKIKAKAREIAEAKAKAIEAERLAAEAKKAENALLQADDEKIELTVF